MLYDLTNEASDEETENDWDNTISPIKSRARRAGMIREEKFNMPAPGLQTQKSLIGNKNDNAKDDKEKQRWKADLEYFDKIKKIVPVQQTILDQMKSVVLLGSKHVKVRADDDKADELGQVNFFGYVTKRRAETKKFHTRWTVLRGLDLYWYRYVDDDGQKGQMQLPAKPVSDCWVEEMPCFAIEKDAKVNDSRRLVFSHNGETVMKEFRNQITTMTNLKMYIEHLCEAREKIAPAITKYLKQKAESDTLVFKDNYLDEPYRIDPILSKLRSNDHLQRLTMSNCGIGDHFFVDLIDLLSKHKSPICHLDVSQNDLTAISMKEFAGYMADHHSSENLQSVILDKNNLEDDGIREVIHGVLERFNNLEKINFPNQLSFGRQQNNELVPIAMPVTTLSLSYVSMSEAGFKFMIAQFGKMHQRSILTNREFEEHMHLDVSRNQLSDDSIKSFAELITKFEGFRSVNLMSTRPRMGKKDSGYLDLAKALKENKSIVELDLRDNDILESSCSKLLESLQ